MQEYVPTPERRYPSPSAQRRSGEHWKARFGLVTVVVLTLCSAVLMFRLAGLGIGFASSPLRSGAQATPRATAPAATTPPPGAPAAQPPVGQTPAGQTPAGQTPAGQTPAGQPAAVATTAATPAAGPSPTARPGQREYVVQSGDTLGAIASRNNTTVDAIVAANNLASRSVILNVGQKLVIP